MTDKQNFGMPRWKRLLDVTIILLTLPVVLPVAAIIALIIRCFSSGPILFMQERIGYRGEKFMCLKFRTMHCGAETVSHQGHLKDLMKSDAPMTKMDSRGDSRIIPFGKILRSSGLDELPQLFNVLQGEMSLVGPRPCLPYESQQYQEWQRERFNGVPGLTGLWQVSGKNRTTFTKMIQLDIEYTRRKSPGLDLWIMAMTIPALVVQMWDLSRQKRLKRREQHKVESPVTAAAPLTARATNN
jgi:lipopolysaccharide/colanic/teichoic acid biosynthesis glycosyltransferase